MNRLIKSTGLLFVLTLTLAACNKVDLIDAENQPALISPYTLDKTETIGIPVSDPVGLASDQTNLWIMSGVHNGNEHQLTCIDPTSGAIIQQFSFTNLKESTGTGVYGITCDGSNVWISVSGNTNKVVKVDAQNGNILQTYSSPTRLGPSDLEFNDGKIWISSGTGEIYLMDASTGASEQKLYEVGTASRDSGITCRAGELWVGNLFNGDINIYSATDFSYRGAIVNAVSSRNKFCFHNGQLAAIRDGGIALYDVVY